MIWLPNRHSKLSSTSLSILASGQRKRSLFLLLLVQAILASACSLERRADQGVDKAVTVSKPDREESRKGPPAPEQPRPDSGEDSDNSSKAVSGPIDPGSHEHRGEDRNNKLPRQSRLQAAALTEASGLAVSAQQDNVLWLINDSGNKPLLFALDHDGRHLASFQVDASNHDWEELTSFRVNGQAYLLIADIGDNLRIRKSYKLHVVAEPLINTGLTGQSPAAAEGITQTPVLTPVLSFELRYPDGSHNSEATAISPDGNLYLITKGDNPAVYVAPLLQTFIEAEQHRISGGNKTPSAIALTARRVGAFKAPVGNPIDRLIKSLTGVSLNSVTALAINGSVGEAWILTYRGIYRLPASSTGRWPDVLLSQPQHWKLHDLKQAEAMDYGEQQATLFVTSEGRSAPLLQLPLHH